MKAREIAKHLSLLRLLISKHSLSPNFRVLALAPQHGDMPAHVRACAPFGSMLCSLDLGLDAELYVDGDSFLSVLGSLPDAELELRRDGNALRWACGPAKGHLALLTQDGIAVATPAFGGELGELGDAKQFGTGLELAALACQAMSVRTIDLEGVQVRNQHGKAYGCSSDNFVISSCCLGPALPITGTVTLKPRAAELLAAVAQRAPSIYSGFDASSIYCLAPGIELLIHQVPPLRYDIAERLEHYRGHEHRVPLLHDTVAAFLKRAEALVAAHEHAAVEITVHEGRTRLRFDEATGSTEEYYIVPEGPQVTIPPVKLEAFRMAKALRHAEHLVFDYASQNILIMRGPNEFVFALSGKREG